LGFFVLVYGYLFVQGDLIPFLSIVAVYSVLFISILFKITIKNIDCKECNARNFPFVSDINIDSAKLNGNLIDKEDLTKKSSRQFLRGYPKNRENTIKKIQ